MVTNNALPQSTTSYWQASLEKNNFPKLTEDLKVDVTIVGGGITGITTAYLLSKQGLSVCLIEGNTLFSETTGNTTAKVTAQHGLIYDELIAHFGIELTKKYVESNDLAREFIEQKVKEYDIPCNYTVADSVIYATTEENTHKINKEMEAYEKLNIFGKLTKNTSLPFPVRLAIIMEKQAHFHPLIYLQALIEQCLENNVLFFEQTRAIAIEHMKHPIVVCENECRIICKYVVQATHYPFYDGSGFYPTRMYADRSYIILAKTKHTVSDLYLNAETPTRSIRPLSINNENYLLFAGENHKTGQSNAKMIAHYDALANFAEKHFAVKEISYRWSAQDYVTLDRIPYIGPITKNQQNIFVATGYRKWGMTNGTNAALMIRDLICEQENPYFDLYSPSRPLKADPTLRNFFSYNTDVAKHLIRGKLSINNDKIAALKENEACTTTIDGNRVGIYKDNAGILHAVDTTCTHLGCEVQWNDAEESWDCPCHGSRFTYEGEIINGPALKPLKRRKLEF